MNYEDPNYAVGLPVFTIHGNHDDPLREGHEQVLSMSSMHAADFDNFELALSKAKTYSLHYLISPPAVTICGRPAQRMQSCQLFWKVRKSDKMHDSIVLLFMVTSYLCTNISSHSRLFASRHENLENIDIYPILLAKGTTKVSVSALSSH